jgi:hypothetical protein
LANDHGQVAGTRKVSIELTVPLSRLVPKKQRWGALDKLIFRSVALGFVRMTLAVNTAGRVAGDLRPRQNPEHAQGSTRTEH